MRTALDAAPSVLDAHEKEFVGKVCTSVFADELGPGFIYTTGFWITVNFPEIITFSLNREIAQATFWHLFREIKAGRGFAIREPVDNVFENLKAVFVPVPKQQFKDYLGWNRWFYAGDDFKCVQLVWPDRNGKFPWHTSHSASSTEAQPDLTEGSWSGLQYH